MRVPLSRLLPSFPVRLSYRPLSDEIDPDQIPLLHTIRPVTTILMPQTSLRDPVETAKTVIKIQAERQAHILVPGQAFDAKGTRHGRGGGWYDRLLANLPISVLRIGIVAPGQYKSHLLIRQPWDEPMDWLIYFDTDWTTHETHARSTSLPTYHLNDDESPPIDPTNTLVHE